MISERELADIYKLLAGDLPPEAKFKIFASVATDTARRHGTGVIDCLVDVAQAHAFFGLERADIEHEIGAALERAELERDNRGDFERLCAEADAKRARTNGAGSGPVRFTLTPFESIQVATAPSYRVKGLLPHEGLAVIWGMPKSGKSFFAYDLAMHVALGWDYRGRRVRQGTVVYLALEGGVGFARRVEAWRQRHLTDHRERIPFYLLDVPLDLVAEQRALIAAIRDQVADPPAVIFVDTLNRSMVGDENNPADMAKLIRAADALRLAFGCLVILIHHCGVAGTRPRGHTSLTGANDAQISVAKDASGLITVTVEHAKDMEAGLPLWCRLEQVEIGVDDEGGAGTSCIVVPVDVAPASAGKCAGKPVTGNQARFLDILSDAVLDAPESHKTTIDIPGGRIAISREWLKTCCISKGWLEDDGGGKSRAKLSEMINVLAGKRLVGCSKLYVWDAR